MAWRSHGGTNDELVSKLKGKISRITAVDFIDSVHNYFSSTTLVSLV